MEEITRSVLEVKLTEAIKARNAERVSVLRMVMAEMQKREIEKRTKYAKEMPAASREELEKHSALTGDEVIKLLSQEVKKRQDSAEQFSKGGRPELAEKELKEKTMLQEFLPAQLSEEELVKIVRAAIAETGASGAKDFGKVMKAATGRAFGRADGNTISAIVKKELGA
jgi:hypothetical protein